MGTNLNFPQTSFQFEHLFKRGGWNCESEKQLPATQNGE
jgi:hypothetical protein